MSALPFVQSAPHAAAPAAGLRASQPATAFSSGRDTRTDTFSQTLHSRMPGSSSASAARTPERGADARKPAAGPERASSSATAERARADEASPPRDGNPAPASPEADAAAAESTGDARAQEGGGNGEAPSPTALAGLPAVIAAQFPSQEDVAAVEDGTDALATMPDGGRKSLHNPALLPDMGEKAAGDAADGTTPSSLLAKATTVAANAASAGIVAGRGTESAVGLRAEAADAGAPTPGAGAHLHGAHPLLRPAHTSQPAMQLPVHTPAGQQAWAEDVGNQVRWMLGRAESKAELVLTPPGLGKLEVSISLSGDQTTAQFIASSQAARDALERALPQLRETLQQAGIMLGDAGVSTSGQQGREGESSGRGGAPGGGNEAAAAPGGGGVWVSEHQGMVDTFA